MHEPELPHATDHCHMHAFEEIMFTCVAGMFILAELSNPRTSCMVMIVV